MLLLLLPTKKLNLIFFSFIEVGCYGSFSIFNFFYNIVKIGDALKIFWKICMKKRKKKLVLRNYLQNCQNLFPSLIVQTFCEYYVLYCNPVQPEVKMGAAMEASLLWELLWRGVIHYYIQKTWWVSWKTIADDF